MQMFLAHSAILNGLPTDATAKISIYNRKLSRSVLSELVKNDDADYSVYTKEHTELLCDKMAESNNIIHEKYITVAAERKNVDEARIFFNRVGNDLTSDFSKISSRISELGYKDRLRIFHDFFKGGDNFEFQFDLKKAVMQGASFKDYICPDSFAFKGDHIRLGDRFARVIFLKEYPSFLKDNMLSELTDFARSMMLSVDIHPIATDDAVKELQKSFLL